ncbi:hypothetical protein DJ030_17940 [bacterium endosymbiont of Escarpia laminata]|nr:MAG: hypothetical protein DJ030_17940 [bacterium endosymbiont of Escarpia laminata]
MIELSRLTLLLLGELMLGLLLLSGVLIALGMIKKGKERKAAQILVAKIQTDKIMRKERLQQRLSNDFRYEGETLNQAVHDLTQAEMKLYQNIINGFLKRDVVAFEQIDIDMENLVVGYQALELPEGAGATGGAVSGTDGAEDGETERLKAENERLSDELRVTMDTMGRMLNEYSSMYAGSSDNNIDKGHILGKFQRESVEEKEEDKTEDELDVVIEDVAEVEISEDELIVDVDELEPGPESESEPEPEPELEDVLVLADDDEALVDGLDPVDIEIPDVTDLEVEESVAEAGSLEDEWAKLLEEEADAVLLDDEEVGDKK